MVKECIKEKISICKEAIAYWNSFEGIQSGNIISSIELQIGKLMKLLSLDNINEETIMKLIADEKDDELVDFYKDLLEFIGGK